MKGVLSSRVNEKVHTQDHNVRIGTIGFTTQVTVAEPIVEILACFGDGDEVAIASTSMS